MDHRKEAEALKLLAKATADVRGRDGVYRKVQRVAASLEDVDFKSARDAFDAQSSETRAQISDRAQVRADEARRAEDQKPPPEPPAPASSNDGDKPAGPGGFVWG